MNGVLLLKKKLKKRFYNNFISKLLFKLIWKNWLIDSFTGLPMIIIEIRGWRTVLLDSPSGARIHSTFCPHWLPNFIEPKI
jgi:hypothetical protein